VVVSCDGGGGRCERARLRTRTLELLALAL